MIQISKIDSYTINYDPESKEFELQDVAGNILATAPTQQELEQKALKLSKTKLNLPMAVINASSYGSVKGRITSINVRGQTGYFVPEDKSVSYSKEKVSFAYDHIYPCSPTNIDLYSQLQQLQAQLKAMEHTRSTLNSQFEGRLTVKDFIIQET